MRHGNATDTSSDAVDIAAGVVNLAALESVEASTPGTKSAWCATYLPLPKGAKHLGAPLPPFVNVTDAVGRQGERCVVVLAAMFDPTLGSDHEYALAVAAYLDTVLQPGSKEQFTVIIDVRGDPDEVWPNTAATKMLPGMRAIASLLFTAYPDALLQIVLTPVPWFATVIWRAVEPLLGREVAAKTFMLSGPDSRTAPMPEDFDRFVDAPNRDILAAHREKYRKSGVQG